ncbi:glycosyl transferase family 1 [alpha proteobacterium AAP81b]|nr:glycosyl transferase family 1 [alpha proteobacterium AAP81b]
MDILFLHQNTPGQFRYLVQALAADGRHRIVFIGKRRDVAIKGVRILAYDSPKPPAAESHPYTRTLENAVRHGQQVARLCLQLKGEGFRPRLVIGHSGWGETLFIRDVFPQAKLLTYAEFFYRGEGADIGFDPADTVDLDTVARARIRTAPLILALESTDLALCPTEWQKSVHPPAFHPIIRVIFDGIDIDKAKPNAAARFTLPDGRVLAAGDEVLTYVARNLEPYRGFPYAMRALPAVLDARPNAVAVIVGGDEISYGSPPKDGGTWRETMVAEAGLERFGGRIVFTGKLPYNDYLALLQVSRAHLYLTYPFVLSWSCLEAMASGCLLVASDSAPVREVIEDGVNGVLVPFADVPAIAEKVIAALASPRDFMPLRKAARETVVSRYALADCRAKQLALLQEMLG